ncbi:hypothetical protein PAMP_001581 [Pampus punctatissimus]
MAGDRNGNPLFANPQLGPGHRRGQMCRLYLSAAEAHGVWSSGVTGGRRFNLLASRL